MFAPKIAIKRIPPSINRLSSNLIPMSFAKRILSIFSSYVYDEHFSWETVISHFHGIQFKNGFFFLNDLLATAFAQVCAMLFAIIMLKQCTFDFFSSLFLCLISSFMKLKRFRSSVDRNKSDVRCTMAYSYKFFMGQQIKPLDWLSIV